MGNYNKIKFRPTKPLFVWDGNCHFCKLFVERFEILSDGLIDFISYQNLEKIYPKAPKLDYDDAVVLFTKNGIYRAASAIYNMFSLTGNSILIKLYQRFRFFKNISESFYRYIASNRKLYRKIIQILYGKNFLLDNYRISAWIYGRLLGLVSIVAFISLWIQSDLLISSKGITPFADELKYVDNYLEINGSDISRFYIRPTLLWISNSDNFLNIVFGLGTISSILLLLGIIPLLSIIICWVSYLSIASVSEPFLNFQWDALLMESYFLSLFFVPWVVYDNINKLKDPSVIGRWLIWLLLFKLMFQSGVVKFTYFGENNINHWRDLSALDYHYWTQPIPSWLSWYIDLLPAALDKLSLLFTYAVELIIPFFIFLPRRLRRFSALAIILFQFMIILSGNYGFFNLLAIALAITLIDDQMFEKYILKKINKIENYNFRIYHKNTYFKYYLSIIVLFLFILSSVFYINNDFKGNNSYVKKNDNSFIRGKIIPIAQLYRSLNSYGLFRVMTVTRPEIYIEILTSDSNWTPVEFNYKPVIVSKRPKLFFPYMPRIDWQLWFEGIYFDRLISDPFSLSVYQRFLQSVVSKDLKLKNLNLRNFLTNEDKEILKTLSKLERTNFLNNFRLSLNNHIRNSYWFARLLSKISREKFLINSNKFSKKNNDPRNMKISLYKYSFNRDRNKDDWWVIDKENAPTINIKINK